MNESATPPRVWLITGCSSGFGAAQTHLGHLVGRRAQLVETRTAELNRAGHYTDKLLRTQNRRLLALLDRQIAQCEQAIAAQIAADEDMAARADQPDPFPKC